MHTQHILIRYAGIAYYYLQAQLVVYQASLSNFLDVGCSFK